MFSNQERIYKNLTASTKWRKVSISKKDESLSELLAEQPMVRAKKSNKILSLVWSLETIPNKQNRLDMRRTAAIKTLKKHKILGPALANLPIQVKHNSILQNRMMTCIPFINTKK